MRVKIVSAYETKRNETAKGVTVAEIQTITSDEKFTIELRFRITRETLTIIDGFFYETSFSNQLNIVNTI